MQIDPEGRIFEAGRVHDENLVSLSVVASDTRKMTSTSLVQFFSSKINNRVKIRHDATCLDSCLEKSKIEAVRIQILLVH